jgi:2-iminoacetate synthase
MEFSVPGFIKRYCSPNAALTLAEYIEDYAGPELAEKGWKAIERNLATIDEKIVDDLKERLQRIRNGERDLYF